MVMVIPAVGSGRKWQLQQAVQGWVPRSPSGRRGCCAGSWARARPAPARARRGSAAPAARRTRPRRSRPTRTARLSTCRGGWEWVTLGLKLDTWFLDHNTHSGRLTILAIITQGSLTLAVQNWPHLTKCSKKLFIVSANLISRLGICRLTVNRQAISKAKCYKANI